MVLCQLSVTAGVEVWLRHTQSPPEQGQTLLEPPALQGHKLQHSEAPPFQTDFLTCCSLSGAEWPFHRFSFFPHACTQMCVLVELLLWQLRAERPVPSTLL